MGRRPSTAAVLLGSEAVLNAVLREVCSRGWFDASRPFEKTVYLSQGASLSVLLSHEGRPDLFVKMSELTSLEAEARRCEQAFRLYPGHAPKFVGFSKSGSVEMVCSRALEFEAVSGTMSEQPGAARAVREGLHAFFRRTRAIARTTDAGSHTLDELAVYFATHPLADVAIPALERAAPLLRELPACPQHGDLVINNLGVRGDGRLVIFDWEDFGAVRIPGLDLFTVDHSLRQEARASASLGKRCHVDALFDLAACREALGFDEATWHALQLPCALAFRFIKRLYGPQVQEQLDELIRSLAGSSPS
jgi:hypothetical protein